MEKRKILSNKFYLYLTEFFSGMSVMAVELGASRLLAPYFSSSQIVWTIIIGTIMIAMALGNIYGGKSADKHPDPDRLYKRIIIAAIWIALIPVLGKYIILGISAVVIFSVNTNFLIWAAFAACMIIFVFPLFLLGTVTPSLVKYAVNDLDDSGKTVGYLNASNTIGSIIGTFIPTFVTIPAVGVSVTFLIFAAILLALAIVYFASAKQKSVRALVGVIVLIVACVTGHTDSFAFWEDDLKFEGESVYNYLQVKEDDEEVYLSTNVLFGVQSVYVKDGSLTGMYYDYAMAAPFMAGVNEAAEVDEVVKTDETVDADEIAETAEAEEIVEANEIAETDDTTEVAEMAESEETTEAAESDEMDVLILGMGTGTYATQCDRYFDNMNMEGVEIDADITDLAVEYFHLSEDVPVYTYDGRAYLNAVDKTYDVIMVDAYQDITIPFQMSTVEFFTMVKEHLNPGGVMVINMNMRGSEEGSINDYLADTVASVFSEVYTVDCTNNTNRELFASDNAKMLDVFEKNVALEDDEALVSMMNTVGENLEKYDAGEYIMTDDKAPVELLGMRVIDDLIADEVSYYKGIYEEEGLNGLLEEVQ